MELITTYWPAILAGYALGAVVVGGISLLLRRKR